MISSVLALALLLAPASPDQLRKSYMSCLSGFVKTSAQKQIKVEEFDAALASACSEQEGAFRRAALDSDMSRGISRRTSEQGIRDEINDLLASVKERYRFEIESTQPPS